jgi:hypothetical protein
MLPPTAARRESRHAAATLATLEVPEAEQRDVVAFVQSLREHIIEYRLGFRCSSR